jgi:hypothetical protein
LGLLVDGQVEMAQGMVEHFIFEIKHYNKVSLFALPDSVPSNRLLLLDLERKPQLRE